MRSSNDYYKLIISLTFRYLKMSADLAGKKDTNFNPSLAWLPEF